MCSVTGPALVLGSSQRLDTVDSEACAAAGVEVVTRRSGGGAVLVAPGSQVWADCVLPPDDPLVDGDIGRSFRWIGERWARALRAALEESGGAQDVPALDVAPPGLAPTRWSRVMCFGGLGAGEVTVDGRKVVGISQRRTRSGVSFHCLVQIRDESALLVECLALSESERAEGLRHLDGVAATVPASAACVEAAWLAQLR